MNTELSLSPADHGTAAVAIDDCWNLGDDDATDYVTNALLYDGSLDDPLEAAAQAYIIVHVKHRVW